MNYLTAKKLDLQGDKIALDVVVHNQFAKETGLKEGDLVDIYYNQLELGAVVIFSETLIAPNEIGLSSEIWEKYKLPGNALIGVEVQGQANSINHIRKKISGGVLTYDEIHEIMSDISHYRLSPVEMTYFASASYSPGFNDEEIHSLTKAMAQTGKILNFKRAGQNGFKSYVVDKHSIGGVPSKGVTPIVVPLVASVGFTIPNTSTRAITTPAGTSDILETVIPIALQEEGIKRVVEKTGACLVWGGALDLAPADDILIQIERPLHVESYDKFIVSIIAKKIATGITHVLIDMPVGDGAKVPMEDADKVSEMFKSLGAKFGIKVETYQRQVRGPDGRGVGPILEARDFLWVLERSPNRPVELENLALDMAARLITLADYSDYPHSLEVLREKLENKEALAKFWEIGQAQGATRVVSADELQPGVQKFEIKAQKNGVITRYNNELVVRVTKALGTPFIKEAGLYFHHVVGDRVTSGEVLATAYASAPARLALGEQVLAKHGDELVSYR